MNTQNNNSSSDIQLQKKKSKQSSFQKGREANYGFFSKMDSLNQKQDNHSFNEYSSGSQVKGNSALLYIPSESGGIYQKLTGSAVYSSINWVDSTHEINHIKRIQQLGSQSKTFDVKINKFKKEIKYFMKQYKIFCKNLLAGYQINTLSHLLTSLIENPSNFLNQSHQELLYSIDKRKIDLSYFDKRPIFKRIVEKWENQIMEDL